MLAELVVNVGRKDGYDLSETSRIMDPRNNISLPNGSIWKSSAMPFSSEYDVIRLSHSCEEQISATYCTSYI